jgi:epoxide hydrolase-like predicted phosphatase
MKKSQNLLLLFDLGNVVIRYSLDKTFQYWSGLCGLNQEVVRERFFSGLEDFHWFERGTISDTRFFNLLNNLLGCQITEKDYVAGFNTMFIGPTEGIGNLLSLLKKRYTLAALSNTNKIHEQYFTQTYSKVLIHFDKLFLSHKIHARKPETEAFRVVLEYYKITPDKVVLLDDNLSNIEAAKKIGLKTILVDKPDCGLIQQGLQSYGITL